MCFTSLYIYILDLFTPSLQFIFLFCFYEMLKKIEENNLFFFSMVLFFVKWHCIVFVLCPSSILFLFCHALYMTSSVVFCVSCTVKSALQMSKPLSELWYKCLVQYILFCLTKNDKKKKKKKSQSGGGGGRM